MENSQKVLCLIILHVSGIHYNTWYRKGSNRFEDRTIHLMLMMTKPIEYSFGLAMKEWTPKGSCVEGLCLQLPVTELRGGRIVDV
jgi:hypothetical protein